MTNYAGIDYSGPGSTINRDSKTGIRYGMISQHEIDNRVLEDIFQNWEDLGFLAAKEELVESLKNAILRTMEDYGSLGEDAAEYMAKEIVDSDDFQWAECMESGPYAWQENDYSVQTTSDNYLWVFKSPYYTHAQFCSPCVPGAGNLGSPCPDGPKTYCLGHDWFESGVAPYPIYHVADGTLVETK